MKKYILGTDWWTDCDDAVAIRILARYIKEGKIELLGIAMNACMEDSVASLRAFCELEGIGDIPVGIDLEAVDFGGNPPYQTRVRERFNPNGTNADAEDALGLYRRLLAAADEPVEILEIGYPQVLTALLQSEADEYSELSGIELVKSKVSKLWIMAGKWDKDGEKENNFCRNERSRVAAKALCELWPTPVTFLGWEIGIDVLTGGNLPESDYLHDILVYHGSGAGRCSWDPMLVLMALIGDEEAAGYRSVTGYASVKAEDGTNYFREDANGPHKYVIKAKDNDYYKEQINKIIE
ncbi:MAG: hypothetical protein IJW03_02195 [Clostridia bacterium]|nr:hypothetical protein [Clostridia bacterium]